MENIAQTAAAATESVAETVTQSAPSIIEALVTTARENKGAVAIGAAAVVATYFGVKYGVPLAARGIKWVGKKFKSSDKPAVPPVPPASSPAAEPVAEETTAE